MAPAPAAEVTNVLYNGLYHDPSEALLRTGVPAPRSPVRPFVVFNAPGVALWAGGDVVRATGGGGGRPSPVPTVTRGRRRDSVRIAQPEAHGFPNAMSMPGPVGATRAS